MSKIYFIILLFLLISCKNNEPNNDEYLIKKSEPENNIIKKNKSPLFMGLNPYMTDKQFDDEINNLNISGKLKSGCFIVKVKNDEFWFKVNKDENSIWIYVDERTNFNYTNIEEYNIEKELHYNKLKTFIKKIEDNYKEKRNESLTKIFFDGRSLDRGDFGIYRDSTKTVSILYNIKFDEYDTEQYIKDNYKTFFTDESGRIVRSSIVISTIYISYYYNDDFDKLIEKKKHSKIISNQNEIKEINKKNKKEKILEDNINDL